MRAERDGAGDMAMTRTRLLISTVVCLGLAACATTRVREIETRDVVITRTERPLTSAQVEGLAPPAPLGPRPGPLSSALDAAMAKLCEYVGWADRADAMLRHAAGLPAAQRIVEPVCQGR